jgi:hypothetical protein
MSDFYGINELVQENGGIKNFRCFAQMDRFVAITPFGWGMASADEATWTECRVTLSTY